MTAPTENCIKPLLKTTELAKILKCSERQIPRLVKIGLPCFKIGAMVRFDRERVLAWLELPR